LEYRRLEALKASPDTLEVARPSLEEHEHLAVDLHSHGHGKAFFSPTDNKDDRFEVKLAIVFGNLDDETPSIKCRLCTGGGFVNLVDAQTC